MDRMTQEDGSDGSCGSPAPARSALPRLDVRRVLQGCREVILLHGAEEYRLKVTAAGKLILTK
jgi:hemin uptake protein HemP